MASITAGCAAAALSEKKRIPAVPKPIAARVTSLGLVGRPAKDLRAQQGVPTERAIEVDEIGRGFEPAQHQCALRGIIGTLCVEAAEEALDPVPVARFGQEIGIGRRFALRLTRTQLLADGAAPGEGVGNFAERLLDRALIGR